jgi:hypothetical protein
MPGVTLPSCGDIPVSSGPAADLVSLQISAPGSAGYGAEVAVQVSVVVHADGGRIITDPSRSLVLVTLGDQVVGRVAEPEPGLPVPLPLTAGTVRPAQVVPGSVRLAGCPTGPTGERTPLPPGRYGLVAVLGYGQDRLYAQAGSGGRFLLVSDPAWVTAT